MKKTVAEIVTERIIAELEKGNIPWQRPWTGNGKYAVSHSTGKPYALINQMLLGKTGEYLTFQEVSKEGGKVKKDEKGNFVVGWIVKDVKVGEDEETGEDITEKHFSLRYYYVFEISQCEGINRKYTEEGETFEHTGNEEAEAIIKSYIDREEGFTFTECESDSAYYSPMTDSVIVPERKHFENIEEFYSTAFHEIGHSTMKASRCNREEDRKGKKVSFGSQEYSKEELVAEITAASLVNYTGLETEKSFRNSAAYIQNWVSVLKNDPKMIISASAKADKAFNYILGL